MRLFDSKGKRLIKASLSFISIVLFIAVFSRSVFLKKDETIINPFEEFAKYNIEDVLEYKFYSTYAESRNEEILLEVGFIELFTMLQTKLEYYIIPRINAEREYELDILFSDSNSINFTFLVEEEKCHIFIGDSGANSFDILYWFTEYEGMVQHK